MSAPKGMTAIREWVSSGYRCVLVVAPLYNAINGYVQIPGISDAQAEQVECHGGVTFGPNSEDWIGLDTLHGGDWWPEMARFDESGPGKYDRTWTEDEVAELVDAMAASAKSVMEA